MKLFVLVYLGTLIVLIPLDLLFLGTIGKTIFVNNVGEMLLSTPRMAPAVLFYILYAAGVVIFVNGNTPAGLLHNALYGALFGLFCYATFELSIWPFSNIGNGRSSSPISCGAPPSPPPPPRSAA